NYVNISCHHLKYVSIKFFFFLMLRQPPISTLFPYTTLFRSWQCHRSMIADYLKAAGAQVLHILGSAKTEEHRFSEPAQIVDGKRSEEHTSELQSRGQLVCRLLLEKKNTQLYDYDPASERTFF